MVSGQLRMPLRTVLLYQVLEHLKWPSTLLSIRQNSSTASMAVPSLESRCVFVRACVHACKCVMDMCLCCVDTSPAMFLYQAYADALLIIPKVLAQNSGFDPQESIVKLQVHEITCVCECIIMLLFCFSGRILQQWSTCWSGPDLW